MLIIRRSGNTGPASCTVTVVRSWGLPSLYTRAGVPDPPSSNQAQFARSSPYLVPLGTLLVILDRDLLPVLGNVWRNEPRFH